MPSSKATQDFVPIKEVRGGIVILKDDSLRAILMASSMNFALKSEDEQKAIILQFQNFLNTLEFSVQFFIQSRKLDITPYLAMLEKAEKDQTSDLMKIQVNEYIQFIKTFTETVNVMTKTFFIIVPYTPAVIGAGTEGNLVNKIFSKKKTPADTERHQKTFEEHRTQLEQRIEVVQQGLARTGIRIVQLDTEEVIELFYRIFNPGDQNKPIPLSEIAPR